MIDELKLSQEEGKQKIAKLLRIHHSRQNKSKEQLHEQMKIIREEYGIIQHKTSFKDYRILILMVLETGKSGTKVIKEYALQKNKCEEWRKTVARKNIKNAFKILLKELDDHPVIKTLKKNGTYNIKSILSCSLTGALTELSKQINLSNEIDKNEQDKQKLQELLHIKNNFKAKDSKELKNKAQLMRDNNITTREIGAALDQSASWVSKHTVKRQKPEFKVNINNKIV